MTEMTDSPLRLDIDREQAFELYRLLTPRSLTRLSEQTGIPRGSLCRWSADERWADRIRREQTELARGIRDQADAWLIAGLPGTLRAIDEMITDLDSTFAVVGSETVCTHQATPPAVRAKLLTWKAEMAGLAAVAVPHPDDTEDTEVAVDYDAMSITDLAAHVRSARERRQPS